MHRLLLMLGRCWRLCVLQHVYGVLILLAMGTLLCPVFQYITFRASVYFFIGDEKVEDLADRGVYINAPGGFWKVRLRAIYAQLYLVTTILTVLQFLQDREKQKERSIVVSLLQWGLHCMAISFQPTGCMELGLSETREWGKGISDLNIYSCAVREWRAVASREQWHRSSLTAN